VSAFYIRSDGDGGGDNNRDYDRDYNLDYNLDYGRDYDRVCLLLSIYGPGDGALIIIMSPSDSVIS
jgi:hypothetical protein